VTIVLGIKTPQGVVLSADTQESYAGSHKVNRPKLVYKAEDNLCGLSVGMAIAGAGFGPSIDKLATGMWEAVQDATNLDEACSKVEAEIGGHYLHYRKLMALDDDELIYGIGASGTTKLFHAWGPIVNEITVKASGSGQPVADFLLRHFKNTMHITNAMAWAVYILYSAKEHADGCGGDTHVAIIQDNGKNCLLESEHIRAMENFFETASDTTDTLLMLAANPILDAEAVTVVGKTLSERIAGQLGALSSVKSIPDLLARLGQSKLSTSQTSEPGR